MGVHWRRRRTACWKGVAISSIFFTQRARAVKDDDDGTNLAGSWRPIEPLSSDCPWDLISSYPGNPGHTSFKKFICRRKKVDWQWHGFVDVTCGGDWKNFSAHGFDTILQNRKIFIVGDSTMGQMYQTLACMLNPQIDSEQTQRLSTEIQAGGTMTVPKFPLTKSQNMGAFALKGGGQIEFLLHDRLLDRQNEIAIAPHIDATDKRLQVAWGKRLLDASGPNDILVLGFGKQVESMKEFRVIIHWVFKWLKTNYKGFVVWREYFPPRQTCGLGAPLAVPGALEVLSPRERVKTFANAVVIQESNNSGFLSGPHPALTRLEVSGALERRCDRLDPIHFCVPGPLFVYGVLLQEYLKSGLFLDTSNRQKGENDKIMTQLLKAEKSDLTKRGAVVACGGGGIVCGQFLYLVQGSGKPPSWLIEIGLRNDTQVIWAAFKADLSSTATVGITRSIYVPGSTWTTGRNSLYAAAVKLIAEQGWKPEFLVFTDTDGKVFAKDKELLVYDSLHKALRNVQPAVASVGLGDARNKDFACAGIRAPCAPDTDAAYNAFHITAVDMFLPYEVAYDSRSWWASQAVLIELLLATIPNYVLQFNDFYLMQDVKHTSYPRCMAPFIKPFRGYSEVATGLRARVNSCLRERVGLVGPIGAGIGCHACALGDLCANSTECFTNLGTMRNYSVIVPCGPGHFQST